MKCFSLFSGIGGFDLALKRNNVEVIGACEIDKHARSVYSRHFPGVKIHEDATKIDPKGLADFDILVGGFPCTPFSVSGKGLGFADTRGTLFHDIIRTAREKQPSVLLLENVPGILSNNQGQTFKTILETMVQNGYSNIRWFVLNSKDFGLPQNRERVFIVGYSRKYGERKILPIGRNEPKTTKPQIKLGAKTGVYAVVKDHDKIRMLKQNISNCIPATYYKGEDNHGARTLVAEPKIVGWSKSTRDWGTESRIKIDEANTLNTGLGCGNQSTQTFVLENYRLRRLTPLECERLQGFPDEWTKYGANNELISDTQRYKMCGNAVSVPVIDWILKELIL